MGATLLLAAVLIGPDVPVDLTEAAAREQLAQWTMADWRSAFRRTMQRAAAHPKPDPEDIVPELVGLYVALEEASVVPRPERDSDRHRIKFRLEQLRDELLREQARSKSNLRTTSGGAAVPPGAQNLIQLIQTTIEPDSWAVNGGRGTIRYFNPLMVLVVRQTAEVHHQVSGVLGAVRP